MDRHLRAHRSDYSAMPHAFVYYRFRSRRQRQEWPNRLVQKPRALVILVLVQLTTNAPIHFGKERGVAARGATSARRLPRPAARALPLMYSHCGTRRALFAPEVYARITLTWPRTWEKLVSLYDSPLSIQRSMDYTYLYVHLGANNDDIIAHAYVQFFSWTNNGDNNN